MSLFLQLILSYLPAVQSRDQKQYFSQSKRLCLFCFSCSRTFLHFGNFRTFQILLLNADWTPFIRSLIRCRALRISNPRRTSRPLQGKSSSLLEVKILQTLPTPNMLKLQRNHGAWSILDSATSQTQPITHLLQRTKHQTRSSSHPRHQQNPSKWQPHVYRDGPLLPLLNQSDHHTIPP